MARVLSSGGAAAIVVVMTGVLAAGAKVPSDILVKTTVYDTAGATPLRVQSDGATGAVGETAAVYQTTTVGAKTTVTSTIYSFSGTIGTGFLPDDVLHIEGFVRRVGQNRAHRHKRSAVIRIVRHPRPGLGPGAGADWRQVPPRAAQRCQSGGDDPGPIGGMPGVAAILGSGRAVVSVLVPARELLEQRSVAGDLHRGGHLGLHEMDDHAKRHGRNQRQYAAPD